MGYNLHYGRGLNFEKGRRDLLRTFMLKGKPANYYNKTHRELGYVTSPTLLQFEDDKSIQSLSTTSSEWESDVSVGMLFKNLSVNMTSIDQLEHEEAIETFAPNYGLINLISSGKSDSNNVNHPLRIG